MFNINAGFDIASPWSAQSAATRKPRSHRSHNEFQGVGTTDWRFDNLERLQSASFRLTAYTSPGEEWDHDHCEGCWAKFADSDGPDLLHEGYCHAERFEIAPEPDLVKGAKKQGMRVVAQPSVDGSRLHWVCPECFQTFREALDFKLE